MSKPITEKDLEGAQKLSSNLLSAAGLIRNHGLAKGEFIDAKGGMCVRGAINKVRDGTAIGWGNGKEEHAVADFLGLKYDDDYNHAADMLASWNNNGQRTQDEVVNALEGAAKKVLADAEA